jgi:hypothetical protein
MTDSQTGTQSGTTSTRKLRQLFIARDRADKRPLDDQIAEQIERLAKTFLVAAYTHDKNNMIFLGWDREC